MVRRKPPSATRIGVGTVALAIGRGLRALRGALGTIDVFRPLRRAGISRLARRDRGRCPLDPCNFLKKVDKNF